MRLINIILSFALSLLVLAQQSHMKVSKMYGLDTMKEVSSCFLGCHTMVTSLINLPNRDTNFLMAITLNCQFQTWITMTSSCLTTRCVSAPDYAYALEYGTRYCERAGVDVKFEIPQWFWDSPGGQWYNTTISSSSRPVVMPLRPTFVVAAAGLALALL